MHCEVHSSVALGIMKNKQKLKFFLKPCLCVELLLEHASTIKHETECIFQKYCKVIISPEGSLGQAWSGCWCDYLALSPLENIKRRKER